MSGDKPDPSAPSDPHEARRVCVGVIGGVHGVRGLVRVKPFTTDPSAIVTYGPLTDEAGRRRFSLDLRSWHRDVWLAAIEGVEDRQTAETLRGTMLFVERDRMPETADEEEYYHADLVGLVAERAGGERLGTVRAIFDFGAGDVVEIALDRGGSVTVPFTKAVVPEVDLRGRRMVVNPPQDLMPDGGGAR